MAIEKNLNTRIQLRYDTLTNWQKTDVEGQGANLVLKAGEVAICEIPAGSSVEGIQNPPHVMMKVGDGEKPFSQLNWVSGRAADVYAWAKKANIDIKDEEAGKFVTDVEWVNNELVVHRANVDWTDVENKVLASESADGLMSKDDKIKLNSIDLTEGEIVVDKSSHSETTSKLDETAIAQVKGIKVTNATNADNATQISGDAITTVQNTKVNNAASADSAKKVANALTVLDKSYDGSAPVTISADDINAIVVHPSLTAFATKEEVNAVLGDSTDTATENTVYGAKAAAAAAQSTADEALDKIDGFLTGVEDTDGVIETLAEIQKYVTEDTAAFTALSETVTKIENGTVTAGDANKLGGHAASEYLLKTTADTTYATAAQGAKADSALQSITAGTGLKVSAKANNSQTIDIDETVIFILNGGSSTTVL